jgi:hypothetical protein
LLLAPAVIISVPLGILGTVQASRALRRLPPGAPGRRVALAALVLSIATIAASVFFVALYVTRFAANT